jgi:hypothetical protein
MLRRLAIVLLALLLAVQIVRNSAVAALADRAPERAASFWSGHPDAEIALGMTEIGKSARHRQAVPAAVFAMMDDAARKAPLAPEPFLVRGVQAQVAGRMALAVQAFGAAERRDPRSLPAHYFLADSSFRAGDTDRGLREVGALARLAPNGLSSIAPYVAAYAKDRSNWPRLRDLFRTSPDLAEVALEALASDPANADAIMALADEQHRGAKAIWLPGLVGTLVNAGQYAKARAIWASTTNAVPAGATVYDAAFQDADRPPPFNWLLISSTVGLAERQPGGRLHVIFYGREDGWLARQLLLLAPGQYRLSMKVTGSAADAQPLTWAIRCDKTQTPFAAVPLSNVASRPFSFSVPANCPAQWLELTGVSSDATNQSDVTISALTLVPEQPRG